MIDRPIGVIDSGVGGLSVWQEIVKLLPQESTIYLADGENCPYGPKTPEEIYHLSKRLVQYLVTKNVKLIVIACNTMTVTSLDRLRADFPDLPIVGTVPVIKTAVLQSKTKEIGILSTTATAESLYQKKLIATFAKDDKVINTGTDLLVPLIEQGITTGDTIRHILKGVLQPFLTTNVDVVALGCTHYPFIRNAIQQLLGPDVLLLDSGAAVARQTKRVLENNGALSVGTPSHHFLTTGDAAQFGPVTRSLLEKEYRVEAVTI